MASGHTGKMTASPEIPEENSGFQDDEAPGLARDRDLARIVVAWSTLSDAIRRAMLALIG
jgi:hypothetical protein